MIIFYPLSLGRVVLASPRMSSCLAVRPPVRILFPEQIWETHGGDSFLIVHIDPLGGVDVPFGVDELWPT